VDDFAFRRGLSYGALLVDLTSQRPVDVLPDRSADTLARWLRAHPRVKYLSRDRSPEYARGCSEGAPLAQQGVDRWHLLKNVREVLERVLGRVHEALRQRQLALGLPLRARRMRRRSKNEQTASQMARMRREARYADVIGLYQQGVSIVRIAEDLHMSRTTVRKFVAAGALPERTTTLVAKASSIRMFPTFSNGWLQAQLMPASCGEKCASKASQVDTKWSRGGYRLRDGNCVKGVSHKRKEYKRFACRAVLLEPLMCRSRKTPSTQTFIRTQRLKNQWSPRDTWPGSYYAIQHD